MLGCPTTTPAPFCAESAYNGPQTTEKGDNMEKLLLTRKEAADVLNISVDTLDELRDAKKIRCVRIGVRVYYSPDELSAFITKEGYVC